MTNIKCIKIKTVGFKTFAITFVNADGVTSSLFHTCLIKLIEFRKNLSRLKFAVYIGLVLL